MPHLPLPVALALSVAGGIALIATGRGFHGKKLARAGKEEQPAKDTTNSTLPAVSEDDVTKAMIERLKEGYEQAVLQHSELDAVEWDELPYYLRYENPVRPEIT